jgi:prepilin-type N-terminal cleavage/methylation domain-containing protein/prepilin-type processing-associated H-X9-DG protein
MGPIPAYSLDTADTKPKTRHGFNLIELIVVVAVLAILASLFLPAFRGARPAARRTQCLNNIRNLALAISNYKEEYHVFPPAYTVDSHGKPLHSWRTLILPYLDQKALYQKIDLSKPWNDPVNAKLGETQVSAYTCPEARCSPNFTTYQALVTPESCLRPGKSTDPSVFADFAKTPLVIEVDSKHAVPWMSPEDAGGELWLSFGPKSGLPHAGGSLVAFADGHAQFVSADLPFEERLAMIDGLIKKK